jgi:hypothetical protein
MESSQEVTGCLDILSQQVLAGRDTQNRLYFIENEPFPRLLRYRLRFLDK